MKTSSLLTSIFIIGFLLFSTVISAQTNAEKKARKLYANEKEAFQKLADDYKLLNKKIKGTGTVAPNHEKKYNLKNNFCTAEDYNVPKKVGLLSFYVDDEKYSSYSTGGGWVTTTTYRAGEEKVNMVAQLIYEQSISTLKEKFANSGMELLTPKEFLVTEKQKTMYYDTPMPILKGKAGIFDLLGSGSAVPEGFRFLPYSSYFIATGKKYAIEKDQFFDLMEMDALIVVAIKLSAAGETVKGISSTFFFKNPGYDNSDKVGTYAVGYTPYSQMTVAMNFAPPMTGFFIKKEKEYTNKKGKTEIRFVKTGVDPKFTNLVNCVIERTAIRAQSQIPMKDKKKK